MKYRITAIVACIMEGIDKRQLLIIGKSRQPRCLRGKKSFPVVYDSNSYGWMTGTIFRQWLNCLKQGYADPEEKGHPPS
ncbi:hypothetical protein DPMN_160739 [Dreissena polymorpha]|uniref:DDE-1 domain-containing protein n=1 Tax=Dreissena polymorpha TaxID=45954 RepID=A0A9D4ENQ1_DREPO|nr:hypothetical protein DPMN_160739 [Dreissena polymorpha]